MILPRNTPPNPVVVAVCGAVLGLAVCSLQGCSRRSKPLDREKQKPQLEEVDRGNSSAENASPLANITLVTLPPLPLPIHVCPAVRVEASYGHIDIRESRSGESPDIHCPLDYVNNGPQVQCSWVDKVCMVFEGQGPDDVTPDLCRNQYNLTRLGAGLKSWPAGVAPVLVFAPPSAGAEDSAVKTTLRALFQNMTHAGEGRNMSNLPNVVGPEDVPLCRAEDYIDLDFGAAKVQHTYPPYDRDRTWQVRYEGVAVMKKLIDGVVEKEQIDLIVNRVGSFDAPGNPWMDGNSSATGRINIDGHDSAELMFQFVASGTRTPVVLNRFYFTIFDLEDGFEGIDNKEVNISGMSEYHLSNETRLKVNFLDGRYSFFGNDSADASVDAHNGVTQMWMNSFKRTVVFLFENLSAFTLFVKATPEPRGQILEFAGWSEMVDTGTKVIVEPQGEQERSRLFHLQAKFGVVRVRRPYARNADSEHKWRLAQRWNWLPGAAIGLGFVLVAGGTLSVARRCAVRPGKHRERGIEHAFQLHAEEETWHREAPYVSPSKKSSHILLTEF